MDSHESAQRATAQQPEPQPAVLGAADVDEAFERWLMMAISSQHCKKFVGRAAELKILVDIGRGLKYEPVVVVTGPRGSGKSALLFAASEAIVQSSHRAGLRAPLVLRHSFDVSAGPALAVERALNRLARELRAVFRLSAPVPDDPGLAAAAFAEALAAGARERRICLVLDGLHCAQAAGQAGAASLAWLPLPPPEGVSVLAAAHSSFPLADAIAHVAHGTVLEMQLGPLNRADALLLLRRESALFGALSERQAEAALGRPAGRAPGLLVAAGWELRSELAEVDAAAQGPRSPVGAAGEAAGEAEAEAVRRVLGLSASELASRALRRAERAVGPDCASGCLLLLRAASYGVSEEDAEAALGVTPAQWRALAAALGPALLRVPEQLFLLDSESLQAAGGSPEAVPAQGLWIAYLADTRVRAAAAERYGWAAGGAPAAAAAWALRAFVRHLARGALSRPDSRGLREALVLLAAQGRWAEAGALLGDPAVVRYLWTPPRGHALAAALHGAPLALVQKVAAGTAEHMPADSRQRGGAALLRALLLWSGRRDELRELEAPPPPQQQQGAAKAPSPAKSRPQSAAASASRSRAGSSAASLGASRHARAQQAATPPHLPGRAGPGAPRAHLEEEEEGRRRASEEEWRQPVARRIGIEDDSSSDDDGVFARQAAGVGRPGSGARPVAAGAAAPRGVDQQFVGSFGGWANPSGAAQQQQPAGAPAAAAQASRAASAPRGGREERFETWPTQRQWEEWEAGASVALDSSADVSFDGANGGGRPRSAAALARYKEMRRGRSMSRRARGASAGEAAAQHRSGWEEEFGEEVGGGRSFAASSGAWGGGAGAPAAGYGAAPQAPPAVGRARVPEAGPAPGGHPGYHPGQYDGWYQAPAAGGAPAPAPEPRARVQSAAAGASRWGGEDPGSPPRATSAGRPHAASDGAPRASSAAVLSSQQPGYWEDSLRLAELGRDEAFRRSPQVKGVEQREGYRAWWEQRQGGGARGNPHSPLRPHSGIGGGALRQSSSGFSSGGRSRRVLIGSAAASPGKPSLAAPGHGAGSSGEDVFNRRWGLS